MILLDPFCAVLGWAIGAASNLEDSLSREKDAMPREKPPAQTTRPSSDKQG